MGLTLKLLKVADLIDTGEVSRVIILIHHSRVHRLTQRKGDAISALGECGLGAGEKEAGSPRENNNTKSCTCAIYLCALEVLPAV